ncbi:hypothetical protein [Cryptosporangium phraense]|uniref:Uncharacterized protein n=1 Tax=Cryptosporangium phraense TaxID=2593070 RepID=A0A545AI38_9ACTN|nr:hypothetical protein [Cryptosporangium phraense]TQS40355.1 hypothetical protein FL583_35065 [Cryptosporangium phraense]
MRKAAINGGVWLVLIGLIEGFSFYLGNRVALWGAVVSATLLMLTYALLKLDFQFLQPWLWHTVGGLLGVAMIVGVVSAFL